MSERRSIYCCNCGGDVDARLTDGREVYPHRKDLKALPFWKCDGCGEVVGCHHRSKDRTRPLGVIPSREIKRARRAIHQRLDPIWKDGHMSRADLYAELSRRLGFNYHTAELRTVEDARRAYREIMDIQRSLRGGAS